MKKFGSKSGFTLVELIVVIAILGILAGVAVPAYSGYITKAKEANDLMQLDGIKTAAVSAYVAAGNEDAVTSITVTNEGAVTVNSTNIPAADLATYYPASISFKSDKFTNGATWSTSGEDANTWVPVTTAKP